MAAPADTGLQTSGGEDVPFTGGERGIRTLDRVSPIHAFQACAFNHSAISPIRKARHVGASRSRADYLIRIPRSSEPEGSVPNRRGAQPGSRMTTVPRPEIS